MVEQMTYTKVEAKNTVDPIWQAMRRDAEHWLVEETALASWLQTAVLEQESFISALDILESSMLGSSEINPLSLYTFCPIHFICVFVTGIPSYAVP